MYQAWLKKAIVLLLDVSLTFFRFLPISGSGNQHVHI